MQLTPSWEDFIQNALISCFINLEPQAAMFKAAGEQRAYSARKEGKLARGRDTEELCMHANTFVSLTTML